MGQATVISNQPEQSLPLHAQIARRAYDLYLSEGKPSNRERAHWLQAEAELRAHLSNGVKSGEGVAQAKNTSGAKTQIRKRK